MRKTYIVDGAAQERVDIEISSGRAFTEQFMLENHLQNPNTYKELEDYLLYG